MSGIPTDGQPPASTATPDQVFEALYQRSEREGPVRNQRRHARKLWVAKLTVWVKDRHNTWDVPRKLTVTTHDICRGGFSFIYDQFLHENTVVCTQFDPLPGRPLLTGIVANCFHLGGRQHRVGVQFIEAESSDD